MSNISEIAMSEVVSIRPQNGRYNDAAKKKAVKWMIKYDISRMLAAKLLQVSRPSLIRWQKELGIERDTRPKVENRNIEVREDESSVVDAQLIQRHIKSIEDYSNSAVDNMKMVSYQVSAVMYGWVMGLKQRISDGQGELKAWELDKLIHISKIVSKYTPPDTMTGEQASEIFDNMTKVIAKSRERLIQVKNDEYKGKERLYNCEDAVTVGDSEKPRKKQRGRPRKHEVSQ